MNAQFINQWVYAEAVQGKTLELHLQFHLFFLDENMLMFAFTVVKGIFAIGLELGPRIRFRIIPILLTLISKSKRNSFA